jgi:hypothetical protein
MNNEIEELLNEQLDNNLTEEMLESFYKAIKDVLGDINSRYSSIQAFELGYMSFLFTRLVKKAEKREVTPEERDEFFNWFKKNAVRKIEERADIYGI